jgi:hypothetical protein
MSNEHLALYLNDHLAGSAAALELLEHLEREHVGSATERFVAELRADITADRQELEALMARLHVSSGPPRKAAAWLAEKATELKLRLGDPAGGAFRLLESLEGVSLGIEGKRLLWRALAAASRDAPALLGPDYERLQRRAEEQRQQVEVVRLTAALASFAATS